MNTKDAPLRAGNTLGEALAQLGDAPALPIFEAGTGEVSAWLTRTLEPGPARDCPHLAGMATPLGVYLSDGQYAGGAGIVGLFLSGVTLAGMGLFAQAAAHGLSHALRPQVETWPVWTTLSPIIRTVIGQAAGLLPAFFLLILLRLAPLAGTHAAEHQVVHAVECGLPLTVQAVRRMPRVHPRCGTNLCVGLLIFTTLFVGALQAAQAAGWAAEDSSLFALLLSAPVAWTARQSVGGWVQRHFATRPATDRQIQNAIRAAEQVLARRAGAPNAPAAWYRRIPNVSLVPLLLGYGALLAPFTLAARHWPWLGNFV